MKNYILRYGLIGGSISIVLGLTNWFTVAEWYGPTVSQVIGWISITLSLMCVPLGIKYYRDKLNHGSVSFGKGFRIGIGITFVVTVVIFIYSVLFYLLAGDSYDEWRKRGLSEAEVLELEAQIAQGPDFLYSFWFQGFALMFSVFIIGMIVNLISNLVLKRTTIELN